MQVSAGHSSFVTLTVDGVYEYVERALRAQIAYLKDRDYVVFNGEIVIVDEFTGRMMPGRQWQDGLHQAIQAKERLEVTLETITAARVTVQDFFLRYKKLAGMTGTAASDARELKRIYKVNVFKVPTNRPGKRIWTADRVFSTEDEKFQAVAEQIVEWYHKGVPVLIGTRSIEKSERLSALLNAAKIEHQILNAKNHEIEAQIVSQAGGASKVTVATNMAGRGTDIKLTPEVAAKAGAARHRDRAARVAPDRPPARRSLRPPGRPRLLPVLRLARRRDHRGLRREAGDPDPEAPRRPRRVDQRADAPARPGGAGAEGAAALPRPEAPDELREAAGRDAEEHGPQPGPRLSWEPRVRPASLSTGPRPSLMDIIYRYDPFQPVDFQQCDTADQAMQALRTGNRRHQEIVRRVQAEVMGEVTLEPVVIPSNPLSLGFSLVPGRLRSRTPSPSSWAAPMPGRRSSGSSTTRSTSCSRSGSPGTSWGPSAWGASSTPFATSPTTSAWSSCWATPVAGRWRRRSTCTSSPESYIEVVKSHSLRTIVDRIMVVVRGADRSLTGRCGPDTSKQPGYRQALWEMSVYLNAALTAHDLIRELELAAADKIRVVFGVYDLAAHQVRGLPESESAFELAPRTMEDFTLLSDFLARSVVERGILAPLDDPNLA